MQAIFDWFYAHSQPGSHAIGSPFTGAFYFDACFWPLYISTVPGGIALNPLDSLKTMPQVLKEQLSQSRQDLQRLVLYWVDCYDYAYGIDDIEKQGDFSAKALAFARNGDKELIGAISQLTLQRPNVKAILALRMASEIFLKALLIQERNLTTDEQLKQLGHSIEKIAHECFVETGAPEFEAVKRDAGAFPAVSERYDGNERTLSEVWQALSVAQTAATAVIRHYTDRDMRPQILSQQSGSC